MNGFRFIKDVKSNYGKVPNEIWSLQISTIEKLIIAYLHSNADDFINYQTKMSEKLGISRRVIGKSIKDLISKGYLVDNNGVYSFNPSPKGVTQSNTPVTESNTSSTGQGVTFEQEGVTESYRGCNGKLQGVLPRVTPPVTESNTNKKTNYKTKDKTNQQEGTIEGTDVSAIGSTLTPAGASTLAETGISLKDENLINMITDEMVLTEIQQRGLSRKDHGHSYTIYKSIPSNGNTFLKNDTDRMMQYVLDFPIEANTIIKKEDQSSTGISTPQQEDLSTIKYELITIDQFLDSIDQKIILNAKSRSIQEIYQTIKNLTPNHLDDNEVARKIKVRSMEKTEDSSIDNIHPLEV